MQVALPGIMMPVATDLEQSEHNLKMKLSPGSVLLLAGSD